MITLLSKEIPPSLMNKREVSNRNYRKLTEIIDGIAKSIIF